MSRMIRVIRKTVSIVFAFAVIGCSGTVNQIQDLLSSEKTFYRSDAEIVQIVKQDPNATPNQHHETSTQHHFT